MGTVYAARDSLLDRPVAIKVLNSVALLNAEMVARLEREARVLSKLGHANIVRVYAFAAEPGQASYLVSELLPGETLHQRLRRQGSLSQREALQIGAQIARGLAAAHQSGIIHRDLKPHNVMLRPDAVDGVKILDFGLCRPLIPDGQGQALTQAGFLIGTPLYMSPEAATGQVLTPAADVYALGAVLYELVTGSPPFSGADQLTVLEKQVNEPPPRLKEQFPFFSDAAAWDKILQRCLQKEPGKRYQSMSELAQALESLDGVLAAGQADGEALPRWLTRTKWLQKADLIAVLAVVALLVILWQPGTQVQAIRALSWLVGPEEAIKHALAAEASPLLKNYPEHRRQYLRLAYALASRPGAGDHLRQAEATMRMATLSLSEGDKQVAFADVKRSLLALSGLRLDQNQALLARPLIEADCRLVALLQPRVSDELLDLLGHTNSTCVGSGLYRTSEMLAREALKLIHSGRGFNEQDLNWQCILATALRGQYRYKEAFAILQSILSAPRDAAEGVVLRSPNLGALEQSGSLCLATDNMHSALLFFRRTEALAASGVRPDLGRQYDGLKGQLEVCLKLRQVREAQAVYEKMTALLPGVCENVVSEYGQAEADRIERQYKRYKRRLVALVLSLGPSREALDYQPAILGLNANTFYGPNIKKDQL